MRHGSLFSGIGGFDLAAEWMGWENVFHCEWMEFPRKVLDYHFPNADSHIDICKTDFRKYANTIDVLTGGFPCQPFSLAGKRKGTDDERYLWGEMLRAIQEIKPRFVIAENVFGITNIDGGLVFQQVCLDLEAEGYEVQPFIIPACAKNAPHRRDRCWFIATNSNCNDGRSTDRKGGCEESKANGEGEQSFHSRTGTTSNEGNATDTNSIRCGRRSEQSKSNQSKERKICENEQQHRDGIWCEVEGCGWNATDTNCDGLNKGRRYDGISKDVDGSNASCEWSTNSKDIDGCGANGILEKQSRIGSRVSKQANVKKNQTTTSRRVCGMDETNNCKGIVCKNWIIVDKSRALVQERQSRFFASINRRLANNQASFGELANMGFSIDLSRINPMDWNATDTNGIGQESRNDNNTSDISKTYGLKQFYVSTNWKEFPTQSPVCGGDDGLPTELDGVTFSKWRAESIKGYGNAIVPQIAHQLFQIINDL